MEFPQAPGEAPVPHARGLGSAGESKPRGRGRCAERERSSAALDLPRFLSAPLVLQRDAEPAEADSLARGQAPREAWRRDVTGGTDGRSITVAPASETSALPRFLSTPFAVQRDDEPGESGGADLAVPHFELTPPSLLQPRDPYARYMPGFSARLRLSPATEAILVTLLDARRVAEQVAARAGGGAAAPITPVGPIPLPDDGGASAGLPPPPPPAAGAPQPAPSAPPPATGTPRTATAGDVISAAMALPAVSTLLTGIQQDFVNGLDREWQNADTGGRIMLVASTAVVSSAMLAPMLGFEEPRDFVLPLISNLVIPVPGLPGYGVEFEFSEHQLMIGAHLDVGLLLPSFLGFGGTSLTPFGNPYAPPTLPPIDRRAEPGTPAAAVDADVPSRLAAERGRGRRIDDRLATELGDALGADFSAVRIHDDAHADALARSLHARAFTTGADVFFRASRFRPQSTEGRELLAHELAHVAQQARGPVAGRPLTGGLSMSDPADSHEREAERLAGQVAHGGQALPSAPSANADNARGIQRQEEEGEEIVATDDAPETRYDLTLSSGTKEGLTKAEAIAALAEVYEATYRQYDLASGTHRELKKSRDESVLIGVGGWLTDLVGDDLPSLSIWRDARNHLRSAASALAAGNVEGAAAALSSAYTAFGEAARTYDAYLAQLESSANWATAGVAIVAVIAVVAAVAVYAVGTGAAAAGAGAGATEAAAGTATGTATTVAAGTEAAAGTSAVSATATTVAATEATAGAGAATAAGTQITSGAVLEVIQTVAANMGNTQVLHGYLMQLAASPAGRALLLAAARTAVALSTQPGVTQREFQLLKQVSELLFLFARGG